MGKISNAITMISLLSSGRKYSIKELAEKLEVNSRMVRAYKEDLEKAGIYIDSIKGPYGGYILNQSVRLPSREFSNEDIETLNKASSFIAEKKLNKKFIELLDKIKNMHQENNQLKVELSGKDKSLFNKLSLCIKKRKKVFLTYDSFNKGISERVIHPYQMFLYGTGWGVAAFCENKNAIRHFEINRIVKLQILKETF